MPSNLAFEKPKYKTSRSNKSKADSVDLSLSSGKLIWVPDSSYGFTLAQLRPVNQPMLASDMVTIDRLDFSSLDSGEYVIIQEDRVTAGAIQRVSLNIQQRYAPVFGQVRLTRLAARQKLADSFKPIGRCLNSDAEALLLVKEVEWFAPNKLCQLGPDADLLVGEVASASPGKLMVFIGEASSRKTEAAEKLISSASQVYADVCVVIKSFTQAQINSMSQLKAAVLYQDRQVQVSCLDRSRVTFGKNSFSEKNFNLLYETLTWKDLRLAIPADTPAFKFKYLLSGTVDTAGFSSKVTSKIQQAPKPRVQEDLAMWASNQEKFSAALLRLGFSPDSVSTVFRLAAAILHIGNIEIQSNKQQCFITSDDWLYAKDLTVDGEKSSINLAAQLLGLTAPQLSEILLFRVDQKSVLEAQVGGKFNSQQECTWTRDALARVLYERTLQFVLRKINQHLEQADKLNYSLLDYPGFSFQGMKSFDSLCSNYLGERIQQQLLQSLNQKAQILQDEDYTHKFGELRQIDTKVQGLAQSANFVGDGKPSLFSHLDDQLKSPEFPNNQRLVLQIHSSFQNFRTLPDSLNNYADATSEVLTKQAVQFSKARKEECFVVKHFNGDLVQVYKATQFSEKNSDSFDISLDAHLTSLYGKSNDFLSQIFVPQDKTRVKSQETVTSRYRKEVQQLVQTISSQSVKTVYCLDPSENLLAQIRVLNLIPELQSFQFQPQPYPLLELINTCRPYMEVLKLPWELQNPISFAHACMLLAQVQRNDYWVGPYNILVTGKVSQQMSDILSLSADQGTYENFALEVVGQLYKIKWKQLYCGVLAYLRFNQISKRKVVQLGQLARPRSMFDLAANKLASTSRGSLTQSKSRINVASTKTTSLFTRESLTMESQQKSIRSSQASVSYSLYDDYAEETPVPPQTAFRIDDITKAVPQEDLPVSLSPDSEKDQLAILPPSIVQPKFSLPEIYTKLQQVIKEEPSKDQVKELKLVFVQACQSQLPVTVPQANLYFQLPTMQVEYAYADGRHIISRQLQDHPICNTEGIRALKKDQKFILQLKQQAIKGSVIFDHNSMLQLPASKLQELCNSGFISERSAQQFESSWQQATTGALTTKE